VAVALFVIRWVPTHRVSQGRVTNVQVGSRTGR
jgi:hypothetical protein